VIALIILTLFHVILGEALPKLMAINKTKQTMFFVVYPLYWFHAGFRPAIWLLNKLSNMTLNLFGMHGGSHQEIHSAEELRIMIDQGEDSGTIAKNENEIIQNVFDFNNIRAHQIMTPKNKIYSIDIEDNLDQIVDEVIELGYSRMPAYRGDENVVIGVLYAKDLIRLSNKQNDDSTIEITQAIRPAHFVHEDKKIADLLKELQAKKLHMAIVVNEYGSISGLLTIEDIIEELVGEIEDEHDNEQPIVKQIGDEYIVSAQARVADVNDFLPCKLPLSEGAYETVNGYVTQLLDKIPDLNDTVKTNDYVITIMKKVNQMVVTIKLRKLR
jgi:CBS domain containing-hemolysin-like protein